MKVKALSIKALKQLRFEHADYKARWQKLVGRIKIQDIEIRGYLDVIKSLQSSIANDGLALTLAKKRAAELETWVTLKRPDVLRLIEAVSKQKAKQAAGLSAPIALTVVQRRHVPKMKLA